MFCLNPNSSLECIRLGADFRSRFHLDPQEGFVPLCEAMQRLGISQQTIWQRAASGQLEICHVKRGPSRGLHIRLDTDDLQPFKEMEDHEEA